MFRAFIADLFNMFERKENSENIYESEVTPSYKRTNWEEANRTGISSNSRGEPALPTTHPATDGRDGKRCKQYVDSSKGE